MTQNPVPESEKYAEMLRLADSFDATGEQLRDWARLGSEILHDDDVTESAELSPKTWEEAEELVRAATSGKAGLLSRGIELDADALVVRATVLTYQWIDQLQTAAYENLGEIAGRAIGYLAPEVELGGSLLNAGLIETDALDRDGVTAYLSELAAENPDLMEHITSGGGALVESLQLRSLLTAEAPRGDDARAAVEGGLRAAGLRPFNADAGHALRDIAGQLVALDDATSAEPVEAPGSRQARSTSAEPVEAPRSIEDLMQTLTEATSVTVRACGSGRYVAYLPGPVRGSAARLVSGDVSAYAEEAARVIERSVEPDAKLMLVGAAAGGTTATALAARPASAAYTIEQVVTAGAPNSAAPRVPETTRVLALEDRSDPIALLGGLINAESTHRLTVVYDGSATSTESSYVVGGRAADAAEHPDLRAEIDRLRELGYLT